MDVIKREDLGRRKDYSVFMAVAEKVGFDRRGNKLYKRSAEGDDLVEDVETVETITIARRKVARPLKRKQKILDDDLPVVAERYREFRKKHPEPGL